jgi:hypothetical protein
VIGLCLYANAFIKLKDLSSLVLPETPEGLEASTDHIVQAQFSGRFNDEKGVFLTFHDGHCLCRFNAWSDFFASLEKIRQANDLDRIPAMLFWSDTEYDDIKSIDFDIELDDIDMKPEQGAIFFVGESIARRLKLKIGKEINVLFKNGKAIHGILESYHETEEYGVMTTKDETIYFNAQELKHVDY